MPYMATKDRLADTSKHRQHLQLAASVPHTPASLTQCPGYKFDVKG